jgi:homopolymeric O-antigen transport system permease protein
MTHADMMKMADGKYFNLLREMTLAQFKLRDQSTFFGFLWSFLNPLIVLSLLFVLFSSKLGGDIEYYGVYLLIGIIHYSHFSNATIASMNVLYSMGGITRNAIFPKDVLVLASIITNTIEFILSMLICLAIAFLSGVKLTGAMAALPFVLVLQLLLILWVSFLLSSLCIYVRDLSHVYQVFLRLLFFVTPIFYGLSFIGGGLAKYVVLANPLTHSIDFARVVIIKGQLFDVKLFFVLVCCNAILVYATYRMFKKLEPTFAENV